MNGMDSPEESSEEEDQDVEQDLKPKKSKKHKQSTIDQRQNTLQKMLDHSKIAMKKTVSRIIINSYFLVGFFCHFGHINGGEFCGFLI
jgi:hypothetical protein